MSSVTREVEAWRENPKNIKRFLDRVIFAGRWECWEWAGKPSTQGYGMFGVGQRRFGAHVIMYVWTRGPLADGEIVRHSCDNRICVNPNHLLPGTHRDNRMDAIGRGRAFIPIKRGESNGQSKLKDSEVSWIRENAGLLSKAEMARQLGVSRSAVSLVANNRRWA